MARTVFVCLLSIYLSVYCLLFVCLYCLIFYVCPISLSIVCLFVCLFYLSFCLFVCLFTFWFVCLFVCPFVLSIFMYHCLFVCLFIYLFVYLSVHVYLFAYLFISFSLYLFGHLSVHHSTIQESSDNPQAIVLERQTTLTRTHREQTTAYRLRDIFFFTDSKLILHPNFRLCFGVNSPFPPTPSPPFGCLSTASVSQSSTNTAGFVDDCFCSLALRNARLSLYFFNYISLVQ